MINLKKRSKVFESLNEESKEKVIILYQIATMRKKLGFKEISPEEFDKFYGNTGYMKEALSLLIQYDHTIREKV